MHHCFGPDISKNAKNGIIFTFRQHGLRSYDKHGMKLLNQKLNVL
jgi:hypothetical protein